MTKKTFENAGKTMASKTSKTTSKTSKTSKTLIDVVDMKGRVIAKVARLASKMGELKTKNALKAAEARLVEWRVENVDTNKHEWSAGMKLAYYVECLTYWNEVAMQLEGWGLDVRRIDVDLWCGAWVAWGRGVTQAKLVKKLFVAGYGIAGQTQKDARKDVDARSKETRAADVDALLKR